jgi:transcription termination factor Rho
VAARSDREAPHGDELNSLPAVNKAELESKHLAELHALAAEAGVPRYRMLRREELVEKLAGESGEKPREKREPSRQRRRRGRDGGAGERPQRRERPEQGKQPARRERPQRPKAEAKAEEPAPPKREEGDAAAEPSRPRRRRRRRFGRKRKELRLRDLLIPATPGRQAIVYAETREGCTALLRELAGELGGDSNGPDPVVLLVDPGPEELADWRREAPKAEIVSAAQARHADDALAQAARRAEGGEDAIVLIDSLTRLAEKFGDADAAKRLLDAGSSLTVIAALERR